MGITKMRTLLSAVVAIGTAFAFLPAMSTTAAAATNTSNHLLSHTRSVLQSGNWSGYAETGAFSAVSGQWTVPTVSATATAPNRFSSQWIGIDGFNNSSLIQTGTEADFVNGTASYAAWWEILPAAETIIPTIIVHPGDAMRASISFAFRTGHPTWRVILWDTTTGQISTTNHAYTGPDASAEWIEEATQVNGVIGPPAKFSTFSFHNLTANTTNPALLTSQEIQLVQNGVTYATPSAPNATRDGFTMTYTGTN